LAGVAYVPCSFAPLVAVLNPQGEVADATTHGLRWQKTNGSFTLPATYITLRPIGLPSGDSVWFHVAHNWVGAYDPGALPLSVQRYWQLDGVWSSSLALRGFFTYNGRPFGSGAYLDTLWLNFSEDSLALYWRPSVREPWSEWPYYTVDRGISPTDYQGRIIADSLLPGEYTLGKKVGGTTALVAFSPPAQTWQVQAQEGALRLFNGSSTGGRYTVYDLLGREWARGWLEADTERLLPLPPALYLVSTPEGPHRVLIWK